MVEVCSETPRSGGRILNSDDNVFGLLRDSSSALADPIELRARLENDGYLYLKRFFPREDVFGVRRNILERLRQQDLILASHDPLDAPANPEHRTVFMPELAEKNPDLEQLIYGESVMELYESLLQGPVLHYDFTWFRPIGPGLGTVPHCDLVYMGRGTRQVFTMWVPYGDVPLSLGGLMVLEDSHRKGTLLRNYLSRDVDSYCSNRSGAEQAKNLDSFVWDGKLAKDPVNLRNKLGGRWLTAEFEAGDMITFSVTLVHASLDNQTDQVRLSSDSRYQLASEAVDNRWVGLHPVAHSRAGKRGRIC